MTGRQTDQRKPQDTQRCQKGAPSKIQHLVDVWLPTEVGAPCQPIGYNKQDVETANEELIEVVGQMDRRSRKEVVQEGLGGVPSMHIEVEGREWVKLYGVVEAPIKKGDSEGQGTRKAVKKPLQSQQGTEVRGKEDNAKGLFQASRFSSKPYEIIADIASSVSFMI